MPKNLKFAQRKVCGFSKSRYNSGMRLASVILDIPTQALDAPYTYAIPSEISDQGAGSGLSYTEASDISSSDQSNLSEEDSYPYEVGAAVIVPFGHRKAVGFIMDIFDSEDAPLDLNPEKLKYIERVISPSYFDEDGAACARFISDRYIAPLSSCVRLFTPPGGVPSLVRRQNGTWQLKAPRVGEVDDRWVSLVSSETAYLPRKNALRQKEILAALSQGDLRVPELAAEFGSVSASLKALEKKGVIRIERRRRLRGLENQSPVTQHTPPTLNADQEKAVDAIQRAREKKSGAVVLLDGVTGSGKTEVYLRAIESVLHEGKTACVLVPEISLTPQTVARFRGRFGPTVAVMHSRMSLGERFDQWDLIRSGQARVVVGARSALFAPLKNVGIYVIDEEHEGSYKQDSAPRYHARDVALWLAHRKGAVLVLGSATPAIESLYAAKHDDNWELVSLPHRANGQPLPKIEIIDMAREFNEGSRSMFSRALRDALHEELRQGHKAVLLLNQRGFAKFVLCRECGYVPTCPSCSTSLTYHERGNLLVCHHCGYHMPLPPLCPRCNSPYLRKFGAGTQRVEDDLRNLVASFEDLQADIPIIRMDADTTKTKNAHQTLLDRFGAPGPAVLLGTQMIAKGLDFEEVTLVGVINADTMLHLPDYRASERTFDLIEQVAGRAGRAHLSGKVLVQTYESQSLAIKAAASYDRNLFLEGELQKREDLGYPPFLRLANVLIWGKNARDVERLAKKLQAEISEVVANEEDGWEVLNATPCILEKLRGTYRWHILVRCPRDAEPADVLLKLFRNRRAVPGVSAAVDVDPMTLL